MNTEIPSQAFDCPPDLAAKYLLGKVLCNYSDGECLSGRIIETEAYLSECDEASHSYRGQTTRNAAMFAQAGTIYVYRSYGVHYCINIVTESEGTGSAVLIRALAPLAGIDKMKVNRGVEQTEKLTNGPGNLTKALGISIDDNFKTINKENILLLNDGYEIGEIICSKRVGITKAKELLLRYQIKP